MQSFQSLEAEVASQKESERRLLAAQDRQAAELADLQRLHELSVRLSSVPETNPECVKFVNAERQPGE